MQRELDLMFLERGCSIDEMIWRPRLFAQSVGNGELKSCLDMVTKMIRECWGVGEAAYMYL